MVKYACKVTSGGCLSCPRVRLHRDARGRSKVYVRGTVAQIEPVKLSISRVRIPPYAKSVCQEVLEKRKSPIRTLRNVNYSQEKNSDQAFGKSKKESLFASSKCKKALPDGRYRILRIRARSYLSARRRIYSSQQPLFCTNACKNKTTTQIDINVKKG